MVMAGTPTPPPSAAQPLPIIFQGTLSPVTGNIKVPAMANYQILAVQAVVGTPSVGAPIIADVLINGASVFTTTANRPTIPAGVNSSPIVVPDLTTVTQGSLISVNIAQVGTTSPGTDLCVMIMFKAVSAA